MESWLPSFLRNVLWSGRSDSTIQSPMPTITIDTVFSHPPKQINPFLYVLHEPETDPELDVVFFHDFEIGDPREAYWKDWTSSDQSQCWPQTWLVEEFPGARILSVSYDSSLVPTDTAGKSDMYIINEDLGHSLIEKALVGQSSKCPVVLVGHGLGGLVMKGLCVQVHGRGHLRQEGPWVSFLKNLKGLFFYATPHLGSELLSENMRGALKSPFVEEMIVLSRQAARSNIQFSHLQNHYGWNVYGVGEMLETDMGNGIKGIVVHQESARHGMGQGYTPISADHFNICKPDDKNAVGFQLLATFIRNLQE